jgi:hypothetical protein
MRLKWTWFVAFQRECIARKKSEREGRQGNLGPQGKFNYVPRLQLYWPKCVLSRDMCCRASDWRGQSISESAEWVADTIVHVRGRAKRKVRKVVVCEGVAFALSTRLI